ncbi:hypothetical protein ACH4NF_35460 [Streptomyces sp. NPDC017248]|uniref:hypothetical protein n=1 Tax=unclassified Streptomyces TaxID=2593676 RepID=UPI0037AF0FA8
MAKYKDRALAMRTTAALIHYRMTRIWDSFLIALLGFKETFVPSRTRSTDPVRGMRLGVVAALATAAGTLLMERTGRGEVPRP